MRLDGAYEIRRRVKGTSRFRMVKRFRFASHHETGGDYMPESRAFRRVKRELKKPEYRPRSSIMVVKVLVQEQQVTSEAFRRW
jgi:hypothetical protein